MSSANFTSRPTKSGETEGVCGNFAVSVARSLIARACNAGSGVLGVRAGLPINVSSCEFAAKDPLEPAFAGVCNNFLRGLES